MRLGLFGNLFWGAAAAAIAAPGYYLGGLTVLAAIERMRSRRRTTEDPGAPGHLAFVIPAHNEEAVIAETLQSVDTVADGDCSIHVIADNCTDDTANIVRRFQPLAKCPVSLLVRNDPTKKAKGFALEWGLPQVFDWGDERGTRVEFVCFVDADCTLSEDSVAMVREAFASGRDILQSEYVFEGGVGRRAEITQLGGGAFVVRGLARRLMGASETLKGTGMWFRRSVLDAVPWRARSLVEDLEHTIELVKRGYRVELLPGARVYGKLATSAEGEKQQRLRWEGGRLAVVRDSLGWAAKRMLAEPKLVWLDLFMELAVPPLAYLVAIELLALPIFILLPGPGGTILLGGLLALGFHVVGTVFIAELSPKLLLTIAHAPFYIVWKLLLLPQTIAKSKGGSWVRTER